MRIAIVGAGAVGCYFGGRLAEAGNTVHFLARGEQLRALRENGLSVHSELGDLRQLEVEATDDPHGIGPADVVLVTVKSYDLPEAINAVQLLIDDDTAVIGLQNGVTAEEELSQAIGEDRVLGGVAYIEAVVASPGAVEHRSSFARLVFGELDGNASARARDFEEACRAAGIEAQLSEDIVAELWKKWVFICAFSGMTALCRRPIGEIMADPDLSASYRLILEEVAALAGARGVELPEDLVEERFAFSRDVLDPRMRSSLLADLEAGKRLEVDALNGHAVRMGRRLAVSTPANLLVYSALKPYRGGHGR